MKLNLSKQNMNVRPRVLQAVLGMLLVCGSVHASSFTVNVNTSSLIGSSSAPFALDFQFNNGSVLGNNSVTVTNFNYFGGGAVGSPTLLDGAVGNISSSVVFNNSGAFQELYQTFTPGTKLTFDVTLTTNADGGTPDAFVFAILDKNLSNIPTTGLGDSLFLVNLNSASPSPQTFSGTAAFSTVTTAASPIPEPATGVMILAGLPLLAFVAWRRRAA